MKIGEDEKTFQENGIKYETMKVQRKESRLKKKQIIDIVYME